MSDAPPDGPGPLGELIRKDAGPLPFSPVHGRVLEVPGPEGNALVVLAWADPGGAATLHGILKRTVEAALLAELSRTAEDLATLDRRLVALRLLLFAEVEGDLAAALGPFGLQPVDIEGSALRETLAHVRGEAQRVGLELEGVPTSVWEAPMALAGPDDGGRLLALEKELIAQLGAQRWGARPGAHFATLRRLLRDREGWDLTPDVEGLDRLEATLVSEEAGPIRFIPPTLFQALCDAVAVVAVKDLGAEVQWAEAEVDADGLASPPMVRARVDGTWVHVPLGMHLLRWCVMPLRPGEDAPRVSAWVMDQFGSG